VEGQEEQIGAKSSKILFAIRIWKVGATGQRRSWKGARLLCFVGHSLIEELRVFALDAF